MAKMHCENCGPIEGTHIVEREETLAVKGEDVSVQTKVRLCDACEGEVYDEELDSATLLAAYDIYRRRHGLLSPAEIRSTRESYGLSQRSLAALLSLGEVTIHRYENGSLPDGAQNQLLRFIQDPWKMLELLEQNGHLLPEQAKRKLSARLEEIIREETPNKVVQLFSAGPRYRRPSALTGFRLFSAEVLMEMMVFFAGVPTGVYKTKLMKELWYSDFTHYRHHSISISGATYHHLPFGPVADGWSVFLEHLVQDGSIVVREVFFDNGSGSGERLFATRPPSPQVLSPEAVGVMEATKNYFMDFGSKAISDLSHEEPAYQETADGEAISYDFADRLKVPI